MGPLKSGQSLSHHGTAGKENHETGIGVEDETEWLLSIILSSTFYHFVKEELLKKTRPYTKKMTKFSA